MESFDELLRQAEIAHGHLCAGRGVSPGLAADIPPPEMPGYKGERITCASCGEGVNFGRFQESIGPQGEMLRLCLSCADTGLRYWRELDAS